MDNYRDKISPRYSCTTGGLLLFIWVLLLSRNTAAVRVIGGSTTIVVGGTAMLPCKLIDSPETLSQISWQRRTREKPLNDNFFTILPNNGPIFNNGKDPRFTFIGNFAERNGSIQLSNAALKDEGTYTCIFTLFPSGNYKTEIPLNLLVPPLINLESNNSTLGDEEVSLATCTAAGSRPPADVSWIPGTPEQQLRVTSNSTQHANGTTTTVSSLFGVPTRKINGYQVQCVINHTALLKEETLSSTIQVFFPPMEVNIIENSEDSLKCVTEANPYPSFNWTRSGQPLPQSDFQVEGAKLYFLSRTSALKGLYQCDASNQYGRKHGQLYVLVISVSSGACTAGWVLFGLLLFSLIAGALWYIYTSGYFQRTEDSRGERHTVRTSSNSPDEVPGEELQPVAETDSL